MEYKIIFDVIQTGYPQSTLPGLVAFGLMSCLAGGALLSLAVFRRKIRPATPVFMPVVVLASLLLIGGTAFAGRLAEYRSLASALREGRCEIVEGQVAHFVEEVSKQRRESFVVAGHRFSFSEYVESVGFHQTRARGGPLRDRVWVRVHYHGSQIARLEIAE